MTNVADVWEVGGAYESFIGRWSRHVAPAFLKWLGVPPGRTWLDVGCGTGILTQTILDIARPERVTGLDQAPGFISFAKSSVTDPRAEFIVGSATSLTPTPRSFDAIVSGLVLNFIPDHDTAVAGLQRVTTPGGIIAAYVWDYADKMEILRHFWDAAIQIDSHASILDEGERFPICNLQKLNTLFEEQGLAGVEARAFDIRAHFPDFQDYWSPFLMGQGPAPSYVASLNPDRREALKEAVLSRLPIASDGSIDLVARAFAVKGRRR